MIDTERVKAVLQSFDPKIDGMWTPDGLPRISIVRSFSGMETVTRAELDATGITRGVRQNPQPEVRTEPVIEQVSEQPVEMTAQVEPMAEVQAEPRDIAAECEIAERAMMDQRNVVAAATSHVLKMRHALALAIRNWNVAAGAPPDFAELHRRHVKADMDRRTAIARGELPPDAGPISSVGNSVLDRTAAAMAGARGPGGGKAYARGAYPVQMQHGFVPPRVKLP